LQDIYLDANASTRVEPRVARRITDCMTRTWANPSSEHAFGLAAAESMESAREHIARLLSASPSEIFFTSGATEALNLVVDATAAAIAPARGHIVATAVEHRAVIEPLSVLEQRGLVDVTLVEPNRDGSVDASSVKGALRPETELVCIIHGNNEIGSINPIEEISRELRGHRARLLVDAAQTGGYCPPSARDTLFDYAVLSAHKMHGPKGVGALFVRRGHSLSPQLRGGGQERGLRAGTPNVCGIAGFGEAARISLEEGEHRCKLVARKRDALLAMLKERIPNLQLNGPTHDRLPGNLSLTIPYVESHLLLAALPHIAMSTGSACSSGTNSRSHVLQHIGLTERELEWTIRLGVSALTLDPEIAQAACEIGAACKRIRG